jgi:hypothetical protein
VNFFGSFLFFDFFVLFVLFVLLGWGIGPDGFFPGRVGRFPQVCLSHSGQSRWWKDRMEAGSGGRSRCWEEWRGHCFDPLGPKKGAENAGEEGPSLQKEVSSPQSRGP